MNIKLVLEYDGTDFNGWQVQPGKRTVQGVIEEALKRLTGHNVRIDGSGRTDSGVHALGQVASLQMETTVPPERIALALNPLLPEDVKVLSSEQVPDSFHARFSAQGKTYCYRLLLRDEPSPLTRNRCWRVGKNLDLVAMKDALSLVAGTHDFKAFCSAGSSAATTTRTIWRADMSMDGEILEVTLHGNGFLYNMVRIVVGALVAVGRRQITHEHISEALVTGKRDCLHITAPPQGLYLVRVDY